jgi:protease I
MSNRLTIAVLLEAGTNPTEFNYSRLRLEEAGVVVVVVGRNQREYVLEDRSRGCADVTADSLGSRKFDGVVIPGGLGPEKLRQDERIRALVRDCHERGKLCAAICHGQLVLISAGLMRGVTATAAWSMQDDLRMVGAVVPEGVRAVRDDRIITAIFPHDLPDFFRIILTTLAEIEGLAIPRGYPRRLAGQTWGIVVDDASDAVQVNYLTLRIREDGGRPLLLGRHAGVEVRLSSPEWEWGEHGSRIRTDKALPNPAAVTSCDREAESASRAVTAAELHGLLLPGGLATWMIRGHKGLAKLIEDVYRQGKPVAAIGRGPKLLFSTEVLPGRTVTCAPQMRDDIVYAVKPVTCSDQAVVHDGNLLTARGSEDLPELMRRLIAAYGAQTE